MKSKFNVFAGSVVLILFILAVHTIDYRDIEFSQQNRIEAAMVAAAPEDLFRDHRDAKFYTPFGQTDCRAPRAENEFRVYLEWCADQKTCFRSCSIETRDPDVSRAAVKRRVLQKS